VGGQRFFGDEELERLERAVAVTPDPTVAEDHWRPSPRLGELVRPNRGLSRQAVIGMQHSAGNQSVSRMIRARAGVARAPTTLGTRVTHAPGAKSPYKAITAEFDGREFVLRGDGKDVVRSAAQSGRPNTVRPQDAKSCKGSPKDSYLNNPRYVGIADHGPIPEGEYHFLATEMSTFSMFERYQMISGGQYLDPFGVPLHGGDWGAGRVALKPTKVLPSKYCGSTEGRGGFFLHGGVLPGSSGCIDVGNDTFDGVVKALAGYRAQIKVTVHYTYAPPEVSEAERAAGRFTYPEGVKEPTIWDRVKALGNL
jgi:type VI secretion system (T6SS) effector TldE1-like protein